MRKLVLLLLLACSACAPTHTLTECRGSFAAANPGKWTPAPGDLVGGNR
jgi:hypothetical protein